MNEPERSIMNEPERSHLSRPGELRIEPRDTGDSISLALEGALDLGSGQRVFELTGSTDTFTFEG